MLWVQQRITSVSPHKILHNLPCHAVGTIIVGHWGTPVSVLMAFVHCSLKLWRPKIPSTTNNKMFRCLSKKDPKKTGVKIITKMKENYGVNLSISITKWGLKNAGLCRRYHMTKMANVNSWLSWDLSNCKVLGFSLACYCKYENWRLAKQVPGLR
jgi:hypothetical protein